MGKRRQPAGSERGPQLVIRVTAQLQETLREAADLLGLDMSALTRLILSEHLPEYLERGRAAAARLEAARKKPAGKPGSSSKQEPPQRHLDLTGGGEG